MRTIIPLLLLACVSTTLQARVFKTPGVLITQVDTIAVWFVVPLRDDATIDYVALQHSIRVFRGPNDTIQTTIRPAQVWQLEFDYAGEHIIMASTNNWMGFIHKNEKTELLFLKIELQGRATLCSYYNPAEFVSEADFSPKHYYILYQQHKAHQKFSRADVGYALQTFFYDCKAITDLKEEDIAFEEVPEKVQAYNSYACD